MNESQNYMKHYIILTVVCVFAFFVNNQVIPADLMEARNLATAQEMVKFNNYLLPTMNGDPRLEKPPLPTWIAAAIENCVPGSLIIQRYAAGIAASVMVFFLYFLVSRLTRKREIGLIAGLILASCFNVVLMGRTATWDIYCHSFMLGAIYFFVVAIEEKGAQWMHFILAGLFMGLSFLGKGPVSFFALLIPFLISYIIIYRPKLKRKVLPLILMIVVCIVVSAWWTTFIFLFHKETAVAVAGKESSSWLNHNVRPWYYYWQFPAEAGIWALFWVTSLIWFYWKKHVEDKKVYMFSVIWTLSALVLLSVIPEKKTRYLLPMLIPGALNIALYIYHCAKSAMTKNERLIFRINTTIISVILFALPVASYFIFYKEGYISIPLLIIIAVFSILLGILMLRFIWNKKEIEAIKAFYVVIGAMMLIEGLCFIPVGKMFINGERHSVRAVRTMDNLKGMPFFINQKDPLRMELVYETNEVIRPIDLANDSIVQANLPFVLLSELPTDSVLFNPNVIIEKVDVFDNNWRKPDSKRYNRELVKHISIIRAK